MLDEDSDTSNNSPQLVKKTSKKVNPLDRGFLRDKLKGSHKFHEPKREIDMLNDCDHELEIQSKDYTLRHTKPVTMHYGSYTEMLQLMKLRQSGKKKKVLKKERFGETLNAKVVDFSLAETGQETVAEDLDEKMIDLTPNSAGKPNTHLNQTMASGGFTERASLFSKVSSKKIQDYCKEISET